MLEVRKRTNSQGGVDCVPALRLEAKDVPPGAEARVRGEIGGEVFRGLELEIEAGQEEFGIHSFEVDREEQLAMPIGACYIHGAPLQLPFAGEEMVMVVRNVGQEKKTFRCFVLGRVRAQWERP